MMHCGNVEIILSAFSFTGMSTVPSAISYSNLTSQPSDSDDITLQLNIQLRLPRCISQYQISVQPLNFPTTKPMSVEDDKGGNSYILDLNVRGNSEVRSVEENEDCLTKQTIGKTEAAEQLKKISSSLLDALDRNEILV